MRSNGQIASGGGDHTVKLCDPHTNELFTLQHAGQLAKLARPRRWDFHASGRLILAWNPITDEKLPAYSPEIVERLFWNAALRQLFALTPRLAGRRIGQTAAAELKFG